jgi:hypothetical protein
MAQREREPRTPFLNYWRLSLTDLRAPAALLGLEVRLDLERPERRMPQVRRSCRWFRSFPERLEPLEGQQVPEGLPDPHDQEVRRGLGDRYVLEGLLALEVQEVQPDPCDPLASNDLMRGHDRMNCLRSRHSLPCRRFPWRGQASPTPQRIFLLKIDFS